MLSRGSEAYLRPTLLGHLQIDSRGGDIGQVSATIKRQVGTRLAPKLLQFPGVVTIDPARRLHVDRLIDTIHLILLLESMGDHIELQRTHGPENQVVVVQRLEQLGRALLGELLQPLLQGLELERILELDTLEQFRRKVRDTHKPHLLAHGKGIANLDGAVVMQADDVAGPRLLDMRPVRGEEGQGIGNLDILADTHVTHLHVLFVLARADPQESDAVAMLGVHVGLDLEHEAGELRVGGLHAPGIGLPGLRRRRILNEAIQHFAHTEVTYGGAEVHRRQFATPIGVKIESMGSAPHQLNLHAQLLGRLRAKQGIHLGVVESLDALVIRNAVSLPLGIEMNHIVVEVVNALEVTSHTDGPGHRRTLDVEYRLNLVHHLDGITNIAVHLVDEGQNRRSTQATYLHQLRSEERRV